MFLIYFISLKLIKTIQKCLIVWNLLGALINIVLIKNSAFILFSFFFLDIFQNQPNMFAILEFIRQLL